jgi:hypothetical protein
VEEKNSGSFAAFAAVSSQGLGFIWTCVTREIPILWP